MWITKIGLSVRWVFKFVLISAVIFGMDDSLASAESHWLEAEYPVAMATAFKVQSDSSAANGKYVLVPNQDQFHSQNTTAAITYPVVISEPGSYRIWGRVLAGNGNEDSFYVQVDNGPIHLWDIEMGTTWVWDKVNSREVSDPLKLDLTPGLHSIRIKCREDGAKLDKLLISNNITFSPSGAGNPAENLGMGIDALAPSIPNSVEALNVKSTSLELRWQPAADNVGIVDYQFDIATTSNFSDILAGYQNKSIGLTLATIITGLSRATTYFARVRAIDVAGNLSGWSTTISFTTLSFNPEYHWLEAEFATVMSSTFNVQADSNASSGKYIFVPNQNKFYDARATTDVVFPVMISEPGSYRIWGRILAANGDEDSFYVQVDDGPYHLWDIPMGNSWIWGKVNSRGISDPLKLELTVGPHVIRFKCREDGARLDKLLISNHITYLPSGLGEPAENLPGAGLPVIESLLSTSQGTLKTRYFESEGLDVTTNAQGIGLLYAFELGSFRQDFSAVNRWVLPNFNVLRGAHLLRAYVRNASGLSVKESPIAIYRQPIQ